MPRLEPPAEVEQLVLLAVLRLGDEAYAVPIREFVNEAGQCGCCRAARCT